MIRTISYTVHGGNAQVIEEAVTEQLKTFLGDTHEIVARSRCAVTPFYSVGGTVLTWEADVEVEYVVK